MIFIAEVKTQSPFGMKSSLSWDELFNIANTTGDWVSIHTDSRWGGSFQLLRKARQLTNKPILAKGIHSSDDEVREAFESGADYVLVVGRIPANYNEKCLIEPRNYYELSLIPYDINVVWNSRNLNDGSLKHESINMVRQERCGWLCQASNITSINDINPNVQAFIVGEYLQNFKC